MSIHDHHDFLAAFDALHRALRLRLRTPEAAFSHCLDAAASRRLIGAEELSLLHDVRDLRNFHSHANDFAKRRLLTVQYDAGLIRRIEAITLRMQSRTAARPFMVPWRQVLVTTLAAPARALAAEMLRRAFSHAPVMAGRQVAAIFDERSLFEALASGRLDALSETTLVGDVVAGRGFDSVSPEDQGVDFVPRSISLADLRHRLDEHARARDRISLAIVTENGSRTAPPLGLLTVWDVPQVD